MSLANVAVNREMVARSGSAVQSRTTLPDWPESMVSKAASNSV